jgi:hypothetical protein
MADKTEKNFEKQLESISRRLDKLEAARHEQQVYAGAGPETGKASASSTRYSDFGLGTCKLPDVPLREVDPTVSSHRLRLIRYIEKKWLSGTKLKYYMFPDGPFKGEPSNEDLVRRAFGAWEDVRIGIEFEETDDIQDAQIRIGFQRGDGSWSYVGRDVIDIPGRFERTMNFGWDLTQDPRGGGLDTPMHEIGHTLGFPHEHQNPFSGIVWDEEAVYREFGGPPNNWSREQVFHNILRKLSPQEVEGSNWDPNSIMHYGFSAGLIVEPAQYRNGLRPTDGLTETDKAEARKFYPRVDEKQYKKLVPLQTEPLDIAAGEQKNFVIEPEQTGDYTIQTLGHSDTLIVLFEDVNGQMEVVAGDDDSGTDFNAKIDVRLIRGRKYVLRVRLYLNWASGHSAVLLS